MTKIKVSNQKCHKCKDTGKIFHEDKWWCSIYTEIGIANNKGYCKNDNKKNGDRG